MLVSPEEALLIEDAIERGYLGLFLEDGPPFLTSSHAHLITANVIEILNPKEN